MRAHSDLSPTGEPNGLARSWRSLRALRLVDDSGRDGHSMNSRRPNVERDHGEVPRAVTAARASSRPA